MLIVGALNLHTPLPPSRGFAGWLARVHDAAPRAPRCLRAVTARLLANPLASSDCLLILADAIDEAAHHASIEGRVIAAAESSLLANLLRDEAPGRAG